MVGLGLIFAAIATFAVAVSITILPPKLAINLNKTVTLATFAKGSEAEMLGVTLTATSGFIVVKNLSFHIIADDDADFSTVENDVTISDHISNCSLVDSSGVVTAGPETLSGDELIFDDLTIKLGISKKSQSYKVTCNLSDSEAMNKSDDIYALTMIDDSDVTAETASGSPLVGRNIEIGGATDPGINIDGRGVAITVEKTTADVLLFSMTNLEKVSGFDEKVDEFINTLQTTEGLDAEYWELDSDDFESFFGYKVEDSSDWENIREVLERVENDREYKYFVILGGVDVVPFATQVDVPNFPDDIVYATNRGDGGYIDFDYDYFPDENLVVARIPDYGTSSTNILSYFDTTIELHNLGGITFDTFADFDCYYDDEETDCYTTPPYCFVNNRWEEDDDCSADALFSLLSSSDRIRFVGHGSQRGIWSMVSGYIVWYSNQFDHVNLQTLHPFIDALHPCNSGELLSGDDDVLAVEFIKAGASIYVANVEARGSPNYISDNYPEISMADGDSVGEAFFNDIRYTFIEDPSSSLSAFTENYSIPNQLILYGDPTLHLR